MGYENYNVEDFIQDKEFNRWIKSPNSDNKNFWENWMACHPEKSQSIALAREVLLSVNYQNESPSHEDYEEVLHHILKNGSKKKYNTRKLNGFQSHFRKQSKVYLGIAASIALMICTLYVFKSEFISSSEEPVAVSFITKENPKGQRRQIRLPDGTSVHLNAGSQLIYPDKFDDERKVHLKGEAFFEVTRDTSRPFVISSGDIETTVLGTSFNVRAFQNSNEIQVAVATGRVEVSKKSKEPKKESLILKPNEMAVFNKEDKSIRKQNFKEIEVFGWKDGILYFQNADFNGVKERLEQWYGVSFILEGQVSPKRVDPKKDFDVSYENESLEIVLEGLSFVYDFNFKIKDKVVVIN